MNEPDDRAQLAIDAILATPISDDAKTMLIYLYRCGNAGKPPNLNGLGWDRRRAKLALVELKVHGYIQSDSGPS